MRFVAEEVTLADKCPGLYLFGNYVTPRVHQGFKQIMMCNDIRYPEYKATRKVNAFFQGGSENPDGKFVFIEFLQTKLKNHEDFMDIVNRQIGPLIVRHTTEIKINLYEYVHKGSMTMCLMIAEETGCRYNSGGWNEPFTFQPETNVEYRKVFDLCRRMELTIIDPPF